jgi:hypothetical protein
MDIRQGASLSSIDGVITFKVLPDKRLTLTGFNTQRSLAVAEYPYRTARLANRYRNRRCHSTNRRSSKMPRTQLRQLGHRLPTLPAVDNKRSFRTY